MLNRTMKLLMLSDIFVLTGFGLIQPVLAIFINGGVTGGTVLTAGLASTIFLVTKSLVQLPFGWYIDKRTRKTRWLMVGTMLMASVPILYISAHSIYQIYLAEAIYGLGSGLAYPTWLGLWSANLDKGRESFQWSVYSTSTGLGTAATGTLGAVIASMLGFQIAFLSAGLMCVLGCFTLLILEKRSIDKSMHKSIDKSVNKSTDDSVEMRTTWAKRRSVHAALVDFVTAPATEVAGIYGIPTNAMLPQDDYFMASMCCDAIAAPVNSSS